MRYALNNLPPPPVCWRCGNLARVDWCEVTEMGDPEPMAMPGRIWCVTPGCVDPNGCNTVTPPTPEQLDREWLAWHTALTKES